MLRRMTLQAQTRDPMHVIIEPNWGVFGIKASTAICGMARTYQLHSLGFIDALTYVTVDSSIRGHKVDLSSSYAGEILLKSFDLVKCDWSVLGRVIKL